MDYPETYICVEDDPFAKPVPEAERRETLTFDEIDEIVAENGD